MAIDANKTIVLITGANKGIGYEIVKALVKSAPSSSVNSGAPYHVYLGARDFERGRKAAATLKAEHNNSVSVLQLDIGSSESIASAVSTVRSEAGRVDVLVNNAGIISEDPDRLANLRASLEVNVISTFAVSEAFRELVIAQPAGDNKTKRIISVTSDLGSVTWRSDPNGRHYPIPNTEYRMSKSALNMMVACQNYELKDHGVKAFAFNPGYTVTELSGPVEVRIQHGAWGPEIPGAGCAKVVAGERDHEVGKMLEVDGVVPW